MVRPLAGKVCLVTGATRGIGKGIALQLGEAGATVYITGRTLKPTGKGVGGSLEETAQEITDRGGTCIPVQCDHSKDDDIKALFERIEKEQKGRLDVLVNNAFSAVKNLIDAVTGKVPFWESPAEQTWDDVNNVGLRNHYICSVYAARMMVPAKRGLIVNISSWGGLRYLFNVSYGIGKSAVDRMSADCAYELKRHGVTVVCLWPGLVKTEHINDMFNIAPAGVNIFGIDVKAKEFKLVSESIEFQGKCVAALAADKDVIRKTGRILLAVEVADEYGFTDIDGNRPLNFRCLKDAFQATGHTWIAALTPGFVKIPFWVLAVIFHKF